MLKPAPTFTLHFSEFLHGISSHSMPAIRLKTAARDFE
jgi:hypothetical protein